MGVGTQFVFALSVPGLGEPLKLTGKVVWTTSEDEASPANPAGMGIEFQYRDAQEQAEKEARVERILQSELGEELAEKLLGRPPRS